MTQAQIDYAVAQSTGEDINTIEQLGFIPLSPRPIELELDDDRRPPLMVDWDELELERYLAYSG